MANFNEAGELMAQRPVGDALLLRCLIYPDGLEPGGKHSTAELPAKRIKDRAAQLEIDRDN